MYFLFFCFAKNCPSILLLSLDLKGSPEIRKTVTFFLMGIQVNEAELQYQTEPLRKIGTVLEKNTPFYHPKQPLKNLIMRTLYIGPNAIIL